MVDCTHYNMSPVFVVSEVTMSETKCMEESINELQFSESCLLDIKRTGVEKIGELVEVVKRKGGHAIDGISPRILRHFDEIEAQLKKQGCWPDELD